MFLCCMINLAVNESQGELFEKINKKEDQNKQMA
jgi:hypothetical protein